MLRSTSFRCCFLRKYPDSIEAAEKWMAIGISGMRGPMSGIPRLLIFYSGHIPLPAKIEIVAILAADICTNKLLMQVFLVSRLPITVEAIPGRSFSPWQPGCGDVSVGMATLFPAKNPGLGCLGSRYGLKSANIRRGDTRNFRPCL